MSTTHTRHRTPECPDCRTAMRPGFILDQAYGHNAQSSWVEGFAEKSFWSGIKLKGRTVIPILTYRCVGCGLLRSYASGA